MTRRYRSFRSEARNDHHPAEPADADLAAVPANGQDHPLWFVTRLNERFQQLIRLVSFLRLVSELVSFSSSPAVRTLAPDPCSSAEPGLLPPHLRVEFVTELFQRVQILLLVRIC